MHKGLNSQKRFTNLLSGVNVINFELNGLNASMWVSWSPSDPQKSYDTLIEVFKVIRYL